VTAVEAHDRGGFLVRTATGQSFHAAGVVAATGSFGNPYMPALPGQDHFTGRLLHVASYRSPHQHAGERVVVVGAGNSAVQVGYELAQVATVTLATRHPVTFHPQHRGGQDLHHWLVTSGFDLLPPEWLSHYLGDRWVVDAGKYRHALETGLMDRRPMFTAFDADRVIWPDGTREQVDTVVFPTGYRPHLDYLSPLQPTPRPRRWWPAPALRWYLGHPLRPGLPRAGVPAVVLLQHPARRAPRRRARHPPAGRPRAQRPSRCRPVTAGGRSRSWESGACCQARCEALDAVAELG
jgi:cation diffusion facilitator CzcD-associated flavoprotein CzcO